MKYYVLKLLPPRSTFIRDMTAEEKALMDEHGAYLGGLMGEGKVLVFGPVLDPAEMYGLAVLKLGDSETPDEIMANDPLIKAGTGFRYESAPMLMAVHP